MFPTLKQCIKSNTTQMRKDVKIYLISHLSFLKFHFQDYISDVEIATFDWIRNSFNTKLIVCTLVITNALSDTSLKMQFPNISSLILDQHAWLWTKWICWQHPVCTSLDCCICHLKSQILITRKYEMRKRDWLFQKWSIDWNVHFMKL